MMKLSSTNLAVMVLIVFVIYIDSPHGLAEFANALRACCSDVGDWKSRIWPALELPEVNTLCEIRSG